MRGATDADLDAMVAAMFFAPGVERVAFMPSISGARRFMRTLWKRAGLQDFVVGDDCGVVVGFAWCTERPISMVNGIRASILAWGWLGPVLLAATGWPRQLIEIAMPQGPKLVELHVHPACRGAGIVTELLGHVINGVDGGPMSLTTRSDNPARRLYERHGFVVATEKTHRAYERRTGALGRILMLRASDAGS